MDIKIRVKVLEGGTAPIKMTYGSAGYDCYARYMRREGDYVTYGLGFAIEIPDGYVGILAMRSSVYLTGMTLPNAIGIIDSDFRGELTAKFLASPDAHPYEAGERVC